MISALSLRLLACSIGLMCLVLSCLGLYGICVYSPLDSSLYAQSSFHISTTFSFAHSTLADGARQWLGLYADTFTFIFFGLFGYGLLLKKPKLGWRTLAFMGALGGVSLSRFLTPSILTHLMSTSLPLWARLVLVVASLLSLAYAYGLTWQHALSLYGHARHGVVLTIHYTIIVFMAIKRWLPAKRLSIRPQSAPSALAETDRPAQPIKPAKRVKPVKPTKTKSKKNRTKKAIKPSAVFTLPLVDYLMPGQRVQHTSADILKQQAAQLQTVLNDFGIKGQIVEISPGPVVTLFELDPVAGTKSARVIGLADDIARSMEVLSVRVAIVRGKKVIGIEIPNKKRQIVYLRTLIDDPSYQASTLKVPLILGQTIGGQPVLADLAKMPHLLVAGTTGSGKSVGVNAMILSLLYRFTPDQCRFIMVDPKMLELSIYDGIPHLLSPVVTDPSKAVMALKWVVHEMENRYRLMSQLSVRNIEGYNVRAQELKVFERKVQTGFDPESGEPTFEMETIELKQFPYIVVIVDELADLMLVAGKEIEATIQRLAQMARAAGIHLIMATQRPSVDVITGTIKANFPTRISFQVTSKIDSRTILGEMGAEQLLGQGDMLYMAGGGQIQRVHGPFVDDGEVEQVVSHLKAQTWDSADDATVDLSLDANDNDLFSAAKNVPNGGISGGGLDFEAALGGSGTNDEEALYQKAVAIVIQEQKASTSFVQRQLRIGYNRAANLIERMEKDGIISAANHVGRREVLKER
jgi:S-DNA-T family DNA segregation ATPase FtsK/SpoIIIE